MVQNTTTPLVVLVGPTAVGKSGLALDLALTFGLEIINADSMQVYRGMDIGSAKPSPEERNQVAHHLIDIRNPDQDELALEDDRRAADHFTRALEQNAGYVPALLGQAEALDRLGRDLEAVGALESAAAADPSRSDIRQRLEVARLSAVETASSRARRLAGQDKLVEARQAYEQALAVSPESVFLRRELASVDLRLGDLEAAQAQVSEAVRLDPNDPLAHVVSADVLEGMGRWKDAADALRKYITTLLPSTGFRSRSSAPAPHRVCDRRG